MGRTAMVLLGWFLGAVRALLLPLFYSGFLLRWITMQKQFAWLTPWAPQYSGAGLVHVLDSHQTGYLLLTDVYLINHWFAAIMRISSRCIGHLFPVASAQSYLAIIMVLQVVYSFLKVRKREPPDPSPVLFSEGDTSRDELSSSCFDTKLVVSNPDDILAGAPDCTETEHGSCSSEDTAPVLDWDTTRTHFLRPRRISCPAIREGKASINTTGFQFDTTSDYFVLDSGSSDHLCRDKSLFVGKIMPLPGVTLQGVGGSIPAHGYGTIQIKVYDDDGRLHTFRIHNVLYVPQAPMNLLSPQKWIGGMRTSERIKRGAMMISLDDVTLLLWGQRKFLKTIHISPEMGLPLLAFNESLALTKGLTNISYPICQPCRHAYLQTSKAIPLPNIIEDDDGNTPSIHQIPEASEQRVQIVPLDDSEDDSSYSHIEDSELVAPEGELIDNTDQSSTTDNHGDIDPPLLPQLDVTQEDELLKAIQAPLSNDQKELMVIHQRLKHLPEKYLHRLAQKGVIPKRLGKVTLPPCPACILGKQHRRPWRRKGQRKSIRKKSQSRAGEGTSVDQLESRHPGLVPQTKGFHRTTQRYVGATIFVDHATGFTYVHMIKDFTGDANIAAKHAYEQLAAQYGVTIRSYHGDNGRFAEALWVTDAGEKNQKVTFCGVGSHHQNGIAEKRIRDLTEYARTLLLHGNQIWPEAVKLALWPYTLKEAERVFNELRVGEDDLTPLERFARTRQTLDIKQEHPLFCPVYALDSNLQGGSKLPRWEPRSRAGVYLGRSKHHASNVALILNLETGNVSPQYHLTFDDTFNTVEYLRRCEVPPFWEDLVRTQTEFYDSSCDIHSSEGDNSSTLLRELRESFLDSVESSALDRPPSADGSEGETGRGDPLTSTGREIRFVDELEQREVSASEGDSRDSASEGDPLTNDNPPLEGDATQDSQPTDLEMQYFDSDSAGKRRSGRTRKTPTRLGFLSSTFGRTFSALSIFMNLHVGTSHCYSSLKNKLQSEIPSIHATTQTKEIHYQRMVNLNIDGTFNDNLPFLLVKADNEVYMFHEVLQMEDRKEFINAMIQELDDHHRRGHWILLKRNEIGSARTIKTVWSFKRKRRPDGSIIKYKARLCAHGGMQVHGDTYWETYAPVVNWMSVRLMLVFSEIHKLHTRSIDFTLAFPQADVKADIYMDLPLGCSPSDGASKDEYVLKLVKNLYGLKDAGKTWFEHLKKGLEGLGFKSSEVDPCIFYKQGCVILVYVDDCLIFTDTKSTADKLIENLMASYSLTDEGELGIEGETVSSYLGVKVSYDKENGTISLTQPFLIERILELLGTAVTDANVKQTPAEYKLILHKDADGPARKQNWSYRSAIGMLNYLAASTRPDILCAVHSAARFSADPKLIHEQAVKRICRYLKGTKDKGLILRPDHTKGVDCYVDASFATEFDKKRSYDASTVLSRTGYVILYKGCPVTWVSKMQTEIALSTTESEYIALSQAMRDVIPFVNLLTELQSFYADDVSKPRIICKLFEDNNGALLMAKEQKYRPRTKHIALKYHHFRSFVKSGKVDILPIDTKEQLADPFTKALDIQTFQRLRCKLMGW